MALRATARAWSGAASEPAIVPSPSSTNATVAASGESHRFEITIDAFDR
jgi:hypothetical protein